VSVLFWDQPVKHSRLRHAPVQSLGFVPDWWEALTAECLERRSAVIGLWGEARRELFDDIAPERVASDHMPLTPALSEALSQGDIAWTLVPGPCPGIAKAMLGDADVDRLWDVLRPILRLDAAEPERAWRTHVARLRERAAIPERHAFLALRFVAPERI
jgi:aminopeptidase